MSSAPPSPPPPPGPPLMAPTSKQSKKAGQERSVLLSDIQKGTKLKSSKHLMNDRSGLVTAATGKPSQNNGKPSQNNGKPSQNNGSGAVNGGSSTSRSSSGTVASRGPPNLGDLFAGGIPRLRSTTSSSSSQLESSESPDGLQRKSQIVRSVTQEEVTRMKSLDPALTNSNTNHVSNASLRRLSTGTLMKKPPVPGNKPALPGPKPSLSQRASTSSFTEADRRIPDSKPIAVLPVKPPTPPAKPLHMQNLSRDSQTLGRNSRPISCAPSFSTFDEAAPASFLNMAESPFAFPVPRPSVAEADKMTKRPQSTVFVSQTLNHTKHNNARAYPRPSATPPPLPKRERNGSSMSNSVDATDYSPKAVSPSPSPGKESSESRSQARTRTNRSSVAEQPALSHAFSIPYDTDFEGQFRFHRETDLPPPDTFKRSHRAYPSKNPKNPANRNSSAVW